MNTAPLSASAAAPSTRPGDQDMRLHGRWLWLSRIGWMGVLLTAAPS